MLHSAMAMLPVLIFAAAGAAQAPAAVPVRRSGGGRPFISPMGEPFRPASHDESGLADWFNQADRDRDGRLTSEEMQADADRFFLTLDVNHDGEIDPDEIDRYEKVIAPEISGGHFEMASMDAADPSQGGGRGPEGGGDRAGWGHGGGGGHHHRGGGSGGGFFRDGDNDNHQGAARFGLLDLPEPVTAADSNFNRGVSREEFRQAATQRFLALDLDHRGYLTLAGLQAIRPAPPAQPKRTATPGPAPYTDENDSPVRQPQE